MPKHAVRPYLFLLVLMVASIVASCGGTAANNGSASTSTEGQRNLRVSGAFALFPMMTVWAERYSAGTPGITFDVQGGGAGKGITDVLSGAVDIAMVSRDLKQEEIDQGAFAVPVTIDAVVATINADNPYLSEIMATGLTPEKAAAIWMSREIVTWGDLLGNGAAEPITVYTRSDSAGAAEVWAKYMGGSTQEDLTGTAVNGDPGLSEAVRQDALGIGFNNIGFAYDLTTGEQLQGLRVVPLDLNADGQVSADEQFYDVKDDIVQAIAAKVYPYPPARELYLVTNGAPDAVTTELYQWILDEGRAYVADAGYVTLPDDRLAAARALLP